MDAPHGSGARHRAVIGPAYRGRIVSLLPAATEMVFALGLGDQLVGVTHECDHPEKARSLPVLVRPALALEGLSQAEIDTAVAQRMKEGGSLYEIDEALLASLAPDLILTQDLCQVCAPSGYELSQALLSLTKKPDIVWMSPRRLADVRQSLCDLAQATHSEAQAEAWLADWDARVLAVAERGAALAARPKVFCMEWFDPVYCAGHWIPEMVRLAGGDDALGREGQASVRIAWDDVRQQAPDIILLMPCGYTLAQAQGLVAPVLDYPGWRDLPAVRGNHVYLVDANAHFVRPGPRLVEGLELLSHLIAGAPWRGPQALWTRLRP